MIVNYLFEIIIMFKCFNIFFLPIYIFNIPNFIIIPKLDKIQCVIYSPQKTFMLLNFNWVISLLFIIFFRFLIHFQKYLLLEFIFFMLFLYFFMSKYLFITINNIYPIIIWYFNQLDVYDLVKVNQRFF